MPVTCSDVPNLTHKAGNTKPQCKGCTCVLWPSFSTDTLLSEARGTDLALHRRCRRALTLSPWNIYDFLFNGKKHIFRVLHGEAANCRQGVRRVFGPNGFPVRPHVTGKLSVMSKRSCFPSQIKLRKRRKKKKNLFSELIRHPAVDCGLLIHMYF